jgi:putative DNA-invertase from lambdoid prophage Rac
MTTFAYIRVSTTTHEQTTENQRKLITDAGFSVDEFISEDGISGSVKSTERPAFAYMMSRLRAGDTCIITAIDRLGRSAVDILSIVEDFKNRGIKLRVMQFDGVDLTSSTGKMLVTMMAAMAELERNMLIERTKAGLERTKAQGTKLGAPLTIAPDILRELGTRKAEGLSLDKLQVLFGIPRNTIARNLAKWGDRLDAYEVEYKVKEDQYAAKRLSLLQSFA